METPIGVILDTVPAGILIAFHLLFLLAGIWAYRKASAAKLSYAPAFLLYAVTHVAFVLMFNGIITTRLTILFEQTCVFIMVMWIAMKAQGANR